MKSEKSLTLKAYCFMFSVNIEWIALNIFHAKTDISTFSVNSARKPEGVGVWGQGKVAFSHALWLPLPRKRAYRLLWLAFVDAGQSVNTDY